MGGRFTEKDAMDFIFGECLDIRCVAIHGMDDADIGWEIVQHHMARPRERVIGRGTTPLEAAETAYKTFVR